MLAGMQCARPNVASPEAQTWPAGRYVPSHASCCAFRLQGLRDSTRAQLRLPGHTAVLVVCHGELGQPGRSGCSGAVAVLVSQSPAGSREAHAGKSMQLAQRPQECGPGCHSGGVLCPHMWPGPRHQAGLTGAGAAGQERDDARQYVGYPAWQ